MDEALASRRDAAADVDDMWAAAIRNVLAGGEGLDLAVQPIVDLAAGTTAGFEVLSRFGGPIRATPDVWFRHAERLGEGPALDALVVSRALRLRDQLPPGTFLSINLDPIHLGDERLAAALRGAGRLDRVVLELTEHTVIEDYAEIGERLDLLRDLGAKVAIDDAGSGYAGLQWLMSLRPDIIKLDRALIDGIDANEVKIALVAMLGNFADRIDAWILAEGMEQRAELDTLLRLGVPLGQGYLLSRPSLERWPDVTADIRDHLHRRGMSNAAGHLTVDSLVETVPLQRDGEVDGTIPCTTVIVDAHSRPVRIEMPDLPGCAVLAVRPDEEAASALARAMTRPIDTRWTPLVCVTAAREVLGIIRMERLVERVVQHAHAPGGAPEW